MVVSPVNPNESLHCSLRHVRFKRHYVHASNRPGGIENLWMSIMCFYIFFVVIIPCFLCIVLSVSALG